MTKEDVVKLGIASMHARSIFEAHCLMNTKTDPTERLSQIEAYERARADWHEAMNMHHAALQVLGTDTI
jgi:hypothetical protein